MKATSLSGFFRLIRATSKAAAALFSLALCFAAVAIWIRSYWTYDVVQYVLNSPVKRESVLYHLCWSQGLLMATRQTVVLSRTEDRGMSALRSRPRHFWLVSSPIDGHELMVQGSHRYLPSINRRHLLTPGVARAAIYPATVDAVDVSAPCWLLVLAFGFLPTTYAMRWAARLRRRRRALAGRCARCGYDLRASADRCPECGTPAQHAKPVVSS